MEYLGAWGTLIHEKNLKSKSRVRLPLRALSEGRAKNRTRRTTI